MNDLEKILVKQLMKSFNLVITDAKLVLRIFGFLGAFLITKFMILIVAYFRDR